jgi:hypothetical protein
VAELLLGGTDDGACLHAQPSPAESVHASSAGSLVFLIFCLFVLCILLFSPVQSACVLLRFY